MTLKMLKEEVDMAELIRQIEESDIPKIKAVLKEAGFEEEYSDIMRLGGMTNHSYRITLRDGTELTVRLPGEGTEEMIVRSDERKSTELACRLGIDSELFLFDDEGNKVMRYIHDPQPMNEEVLRRKENIVQAAHIFHKLHTCGEDTGVRFEVFEMAALYERIILEAGVALYPDYDEVKQTVMNIKSEMDKINDVTRVPCHNDSLVGNWVLDSNGKLYLIDWEYSGMNEAMWDLSCLSIEAEFTEAEDDELLEQYYSVEGKRADTDKKKYFIAAKMYVDYLWTLWGLTRVPFDGAFMQEYADARYSRLKKNIEAYKKID